MTTAQVFASRFEDGNAWISHSGELFENVLNEYNAEMEYGHAVLDQTGGVWVSEVSREDHVFGQPVRYVFKDGSAIVESGDCWGIEGDEKFSWAD